MDVVAELCCLCTLPAVTLPAPWPRLSCLCAFMVEPSGARVSVISFVCQDSKFLSGLSSFCQDSQVCLSGLSSLRQDCPIRTIPQRARTVETGAGRLSFTAGGEGKEGCSEGSWKVEVSSEALVSTVKTVRRQDPARTLSGLCQDSVRTLSGLCQDCQDRCGRSTNQVLYSCGNSRERRARAAIAGWRGERAGRGVVAPSDGLLPRAATVGRRPGGQKPGDDGALDGA